MKISRRAVCVMCWSVLLLWFPPGSGAGTTNCQGVENDLWKQWGEKKLPRNDATIDKLRKVKQDCPQLGNSMGFIVDEIKAQREKVAEAVDVVKEAVEQLTKKAANTGQEGNQ